MFVVVVFLYISLYDNWDQLYTNIRIKMKGESRRWWWLTRDRISSWCDPIIIQQSIIKYFILSISSSGSLTSAEIKLSIKHTCWNFVTLAILGRMWGLWNHPDKASVSVNQAASMAHSTETQYYSRMSFICQKH